LAEIRTVLSKFDIDTMFSPYL